MSTESYYPLVWARKVVDRGLSRQLYAGLALGVAVLSAGAFAQGATLSWDPLNTPATPSGGTGNWDTTSTDLFWFDGTSDLAWTDVSATGTDSASFGGTAGTVSLANTLSALGLSFSIPGYTIAGTNTLTLGSAGISAGTLTTGSTTISAPILMAANQSWTTGSGTNLLISGPVANGGFLLTTNGAGTSNISGSVSGSGGITQGGSGMLILSGTNTYSGASTISAGTMEFQNAAAMSSTSSLTMANGSTLSLRADTASTFAPSTFTNFTAGSTYNISVNDLTAAGAGQTLSIKAPSGGGGGASTTTLNVSSTTGDVLKFTTAFATNSNSGSAWTTSFQNVFNLNGADVVLNGGVSMGNNGDGGITVNSSTGNALTINGVVTTNTNRTTAGIVNSGVLNLNNTVSLGGSNQGFFVFLNGGTLNVNNAGAIRNNSAISGGRAGLVISGGVLNNASGAALTLSFNPTIQFNGDFAFSTAAGTSANNLNLGTGAASLGTAAGTTRTITVNGSAKLTVGSVIANGTTATGLTTAGTGTLNLTGASTFTGPTTVTGGTLLLSGTGAVNSSSGIVLNGASARLVQSSSTAISSPVTITQGTLDGTTTVNNVTVADAPANTITNGNGTGLGTLTAGALTFNGRGMLNVNQAGTTNGIAVTGALTTANTAAGEIVVNASNNAGWTSGNIYNLVTFGSLTGGLADFATGTIAGLSPRQSAALGVSATAVTLTISGDTPVWSGAGTGLWTTAATGDNTGPNNWALKSAHTGTNFWATDAVEFNDTYNAGSGDAAPATTITIHGGNVSPSAVTFNNSALNYTLASDDGSGIAAGTLVKNGSGTLTITSSNSYSGGTTINAGTIAVSSPTNLGSSSGQLTLNGGTLEATAGFTSTRNIVIGSSNGTVLTDLAVSLTLSGNISGAGTLIKNGIGSLVLSGANTHGGTTLNAGTLLINSNNALGSGTFTVGGGTIDNTSAAPVTQSATAQVWNADINFTGTQSLNLGTGTVTLGGNRQVTVSANNLTVAGAIGDGGSGFGITKLGTGTLTLGSAQSTYTGNTTLAAGTVVVPNGNIAPFGTGTLVLNAASASTPILIVQPSNGSSPTSSTSDFIPNNIVVQAATTNIIDDSQSNFGNLWLGGDWTGTGTVLLQNSGTVASPAALFLGSHLGAFQGTIDLESIQAGKNMLALVGMNNLGENVNVFDASQTRWILGGGTNGAAGNGVIKWNNNAPPGGSATIKLGSLEGTSPTSLISASSAPATFEIGALNTSTTYAGQITDGGGTNFTSLNKVGTGTLTLAGTNTYTGTTNITAGALVAANAQALGNSSVTIHAGSKLLLQNGLAKAVVIPALNFDGSTGSWSGALDLTNNKLVVEATVSKATALANLQDQAHSVISSSTMPANFAIAVIDNDNGGGTRFSTFGGQAVDANSILISQELLGDANADGTVNTDDLNTVLNNFGAASPAWTSGNFDGAPTIDLTDLAFVLNNFGQNNSSPSTSGPTAVVGTPEPASLALVAAGTVALISSRRRRSGLR